MGAEPCGKYLYAAEGMGTGLAAFAINPTNGALNAAVVPGSPYTMPSPATAIAFHPSGKFLYLGVNGGNINKWAIASDGSLTSQGLAATTAWVYDLSVDAGGKFLWALVGCGTLSTIVPFSMDPVTGALTPTGGGITCVPNTTRITTVSY